jgi:CubicO group peptidase (beta-lactamase class C family)
MTLRAKSTWFGLCGLACAALGAQERAAPEAAPREAALRDCLAGAAERLDFSGVVLVARGKDTVVHARGREGAGGALTPAHRFNLASAGKMFTAVAVAQLIDAGQVHLSDPIGRFVDGLTPEAAAVTVEQLLAHTSGLGNYFKPENLPALEQARDLAALKPLIASERPASPPGSRFSYSNSGFLLLGLLIERASGQGYDDYLQQHVFTPAGMSATQLDPARASPRAIGLTRMGPAGPQPELREAPEAALRGGPAGGAFSTAEDLRRFFTALTAGKLVRADTLQAMTAEHSRAAPARGGLPELAYGLGFGVGALDGHRWFGHNGGAPGANAEAVALPDQQVIVIVLSNRDPPTASALYRAVRGAALGGTCEATSASKR